jgi:hypothetical protein
VEILERIASNPASPRQLAEKTDEPLRRIVYHISVLHQSGCVRPIRADEAGSSDCVYELATLLPEPPRLQLSDSTRGHALASVLRRIVERGFEALTARTLGGAENQASCESLLLDREGWRETQAILSDAANRIAAAKEAAAKRLAQSDEPGIATTVALVAFEAASETEPSA